MLKNEGNKTCLFILYNNNTGQVTQVFCNENRYKFSLYVYILYHNRMEQHNKFHQYKLFTNGLSTT